MGGLKMKEEAVNVSVSRTSLRPFCIVCGAVAVAINFIKIVVRMKVPIAVCLSGSMAPTLNTGDLLLLSDNRDILPFRPGEIVVFNMRNSRKPERSSFDIYVHRIMEVHAGNQSEPHLLLTKGDNNILDDAWLYAQGRNKRAYISSEHVLGRVVAVIPYIGMVKVWAIHCELVRVFFIALPVAILGYVALGWNGLIVLANEKTLIKM